MNLLQLVLKYLGYQARGTLQATIASVRPYIKYLGFGIASLVSAVVCLLFTLFFFFVSFFFFLINHSDWSIAGLWTSLITALLSIILFLISYTLLSKPPHR